MTVTILLKYWKSILLIVLLLFVVALSSLCFIQYKELSLNDANINRINTEWEAKFNKINEEGVALQKEYDLLEQQHKIKVEALDEKNRQLKLESDRTYNSLLISNDSLHKTIRDTTSKLSNVSRETAIDYSQRASKVFGECSARYIDVAKAANDLGIDRDALDEAYPSTKSDSK